MAESKSPVVEKVKGAVSFGMKMLGLLGMVFLLWLCSLFLFFTISERDSTRRSAEDEISRSWANTQTVAGPILVIPYRETERIEENEGKKIRTVLRTRYATFLPESLKVEGGMKPEVRYRGIFEAVLYTADLKVSARFTRPSFSALRIPEQDVLWQYALISLGVSDLRGIQEQVTLKGAGRSVGFAPGPGEGSFLSSGIHSRALPLSAASFGGKGLDLELDLKLNGSRNLSFLPLGRETKVALKSSWNDPSFNGEYLPASREINEQGFSANWTVLELARSFPQFWTKDSVPSETVTGTAFGVGMATPGSAYQRNTRALKYAILFILLSFTAFFLFEVNGDLRLHPFQYLLVGAALCVFYLLLLSLSEHVGFNAAYGIATAGILAVVGGYCRSILQDRRRAWIMTGLLAFLYGYLFVVLQLEDYALLIGSVGIFITLAVVMWVTRKIDWYRGGVGKKG